MLKVSIHRTEKDDDRYPQYWALIEKKIQYLREISAILIPFDAAHVTSNLNY